MSKYIKMLHQEYIHQRTLVYLTITDGKRLTYHEDDLMILSGCGLLVNCLFFKFLFPG